MLAKLRSATTQGIAATIVDVEINIVPAMHRFEIVGLPDSAVKESSERFFAEGSYCHQSSAARRDFSKQKP